jgi:quercetin dioxygenase-like cupin family protein
MLAGLEFRVRQQHCPAMPISTTALVGTVLLVLATLSSGCATCPNPDAHAATTPATPAQPQPAQTEPAVAPTPDAAPPLTKPQLANLLKQPLAENDKLEVVISRVVVPPNFRLPLHYHPGQEFVYTVEGTATVQIKGQPDALLKAGEAFVVPPRVHHTAVTNDEQATVIVFRVHDPGKPVRYIIKPSGEEVPVEK